MAAVAPLVRWRRRLLPFWRAYELWQRQGCLDLSAAFAYHSLQSFFPLLLIVLSLAARVLGNDDGLLEKLFLFADQVLPDSAIPVVRSTLIRFTRQGAGAGLVGLVFLLVSASNAFLSLQRGADRLWWNRPEAWQGLPWTVLVREFIKSRLQAFALVVALGLLVSLDQVAINLRLLAPSMVRQWLLQNLPAPLRFLPPLSFAADLLLSSLLAFVAALALLWVLPSRRIRFRPLLPGAALIGFSLTLLNVLVGRSLLSLGIRYQAYGVVGGVLVLSLWVWAAALVFYYGQCLSVVLARSRHGRFTGGHPYAAVAAARFAAGEDGNTDAPGIKP